MRRTDKRTDGRRNAAYMGWPHTALGVRGRAAHLQDSRVPA